MGGRLAHGQVGMRWPSGGPSPAVCLQRPHRWAPVREAQGSEPGGASAMVCPEMQVKPREGPRLPALPPTRGREPVFPGLSPFSTCFSSLLFLFKCHSLGEITEPSLSIIRVKGIRKGLGFQSSHCPEDAGLTPLLPTPGLPLLPCGCGWLSNAGPRGPCTFLPELSSLQLSLSQLAASPRSPTQCHSAKPSSQQPDNPELSQAQAVSGPHSFQAVAPDS